MNVNFFRIATLGIISHLLVSCASVPSPGTQSFVAPKSYIEPLSQNDEDLDETKLGIWLFDEEGLEIHVSRLDEGLSINDARSNATRFTIISDAKKTAFYYTERVNVGKLNTDSTKELDADAILSMLASLDNEDIRLSKFKGSIVLKPYSPADITLQNVDINRDTPNVFSHLRLTLSDSLEAGNVDELVSSTVIDCVSYPSFICVKGSEAPAKVFPN